MRTSQDALTFEQDPIPDGFFVVLQDPDESALKCRQDISPIDLVHSMMLEITKKSNQEE